MRTDGPRRVDFKESGRTGCAFLRLSVLFMLENSLLAAVGELEERSSAGPTMMSRLPIGTGSVRDVTWWVYAIPRDASWGVGLTYWWWWTKGSDEWWPCLWCGERDELAVVTGRCVYDILEPRDMGCLEAGRLWSTTGECE